MREFSVEVNSRNGEPALGYGTVVVEYRSSWPITWRENGHWVQRYKRLAFFNTYRWSCLGNRRLGVEHLRYGDDNPVQLVTLENTGNDFESGRWISTSPHFCGNDSYELKLFVKTNNLTLVWHIEGPEKNQVSTIRYF